MTDLTREQIEALLKYGSTKHAAITIARQLLATMNALAEAQKREAGLREAMNEADRFLSDPLDPDDVICARDLLRAAISTAPRSPTPFAPPRET